MRSGKTAGEYGEGNAPRIPRRLRGLFAGTHPILVVFETGSLATWFFHVLKAEGLPAICIEARHAQKILGETLNKTDANDAEGLARLAETGFYKAVRVKSFEAMMIRSLVAARTHLLTITTQLTNQIRRLMKTFGLVVPKSKGRVFAKNVQDLLDGHVELARIITPVLETWRAVKERASALSRQLKMAARQSRSTRLLMTIPGVGAITAISYVAAIEDPQNFAKSRSVGAWLGLTTRRYQSGEVDFDGHISRRGDHRLRGLLYEAATSLLTRTPAETVSDLKTWGLQLRERLGFKRAAVAVARKLAVIMHSMLKTGQDFIPTREGRA